MAHGLDNDAKEQKSDDELFYFNLIDDGIGVFTKSSLLLYHREYGSKQYGSDCQLLCRMLGIDVGDGFVATIDDTNPFFNDETNQFSLFEKLNIAQFSVIKHWIGHYHLNNLIYLRKENIKKSEYQMLQSVCKLWGMTVLCDQLSNMYRSIKPVYNPMTPEQDTLDQFQWTAVKTTFGPAYNDSLIQEGYSATVINNESLWMRKKKIVTKK